MIGTVLIQPQRVRRAASASPDAEIVHDIVRLGAHILADSQSGGRIVAEIGEAMEATSARMQEQAETGFASAQQRLRAWLQPVIARVLSLAENTVSPEDPAAGIELGQRLLSSISELAGELTLDQLREHVGLILDVLETDLGVTSSFIEDRIWDLIDDTIARLEEPNTELTSVERGRHLETASVLRRLKRRFQDSFTFPEFDAEHIARLLLDLLRDSGIDSIARRASCTSGRMNDALQAGTTLTGIVPFGTNGAAPPGPSLLRSLGAAVAAAEAKETYAWYATWLLQYKKNLLFGLSDISNATRFASDLKGGSRPLDVYLRQQFSAEADQALQDYPGSGEPPEELRLVVLGELNRLIRGPSLHTAARFSGITLSGETRELLDEFPQGDELVRLNRMLLEDAYSGALNKLPRNFVGKSAAGFADWFLEVAGWPGEKVFVNREGTRIVHGDKPVFTGTGLDWTKAPIFDRDNHRDEEKYYIFDHISEEFLDGWAFHTSWISDAIRLVWHLTYIDPAHQLPPVLNSVYDATHLTTKLVASRPFSGFHFFSHKWLDWTPVAPALSWGAPTVLSSAGSFQGRHDDASFINQLAFLFTVWLGDMINLVGPVGTTNALRDASLSFMTLYNFGGPHDAPSTLPQRPAQNHKEIDGIVNLAVTAVSYWLASLVDRRDYVNPAGMPGNVAKLWLLGGAGMGLLGGFVGTVLAEIIAWAEDWGLLGKTMLKSMPKVMVLFWPLLYSLREGDTDGGRFNAAGAPFRGYPTKTRPDGTATPSPYLLPYASGVTYTCGQGNAGMWSHNRIFNPTPSQTYAYDFGFDQADEILASRPGTVVDFFEWVPDDTAPANPVSPPVGTMFAPEQTRSSSWNFIIIRHDVDDAGNLITPNPDHDLDVNGNLAVTFTVYGHGRQNGVTAAFGRWATPVPTASIVGARVKRGQPIMLAGDTGTSFHNHLHMHVLAETRPGGTPTAPATNAVRNGAYTIPFIFQDVDGDGVCQHLRWYTSKNTRRIS